MVIMLTNYGNIVDEIHQCGVATYISIFILILNKREKESTKASHGLI
jgi:hypothetical protein